MKYVRGSFFIEEKKFISFKDFFKSNLSSQTFRDTLKLKDFKIEAKIFPKGCYLVLDINIFNKDGRLLVNHKSSHRSVSSLFGLKKIINENTVFYIYLSIKDTSFETLLSNLHLYRWDCKSEYADLEDFINFFDLEDELNVMKLIFFSLMKIEDIYDNSLKELIISKLNYYGYYEESYKKINFDSEDADLECNTTDEILNKCLSVLYYHIDNKLDKCNFSRLNSFIYSEYEYYINKLILN